MGCSGDYRHVIHVPRDLDWKLIRFRDPDQDSLLATDLEVMQKAERERLAALPPPPPPPPPAAAGAGGTAGDALNGSLVGVVLPPPPLLPGDSGFAGQQDEDHNEKEEAAAAHGGGQGGEVEEAEGKLLGLQLEFELPPSCYATMLLRELTKECTSKAAHKAASLHGRRLQRRGEGGEGGGGDDEEGRDGDEEME